MRHGTPNPMSRRTLGGIIAALAFATACGADSSTRVPATPVPSALGAVSAAQTAEVGTALAAPVQVRVTDASGAVVGGATVSWSPSAGAVTVATSTTNASGVAQTYWTLGTAAGAQQLTATVSGGSGIAPVVIQATATPGPSTGITIAPQALVVSQLDSIGFTVTVKPDRYGNAVAGTPTISIGDSATADVRSGRVVAGRAGRTTITVSAGGVTGSATVRVTPIWRAIGAGFAQSCALDALGYAFCWGDNRLGALGRTSITFDSIPVPVSGALRFASLTVGSGHACGLTATGQAYCWGSNTARQLGIGTTSDSAMAPTAVAGGHTFTALSAHGPFTCGIVTGGAAYCWGWEGEGELGNGASGTFNGQPSPVAVNGGLTFASITAGGSHTCGMTTTNVSYCWGNDYEGQVGDAASSVGYRTSPTAVAGPTAFTRLFTGDAHSCGLDASGSTWCWGSSYSGQAGDAGFAPRYAPVQIPTPSPFVSLGLGGNHSCGLTAAGDVYCWGLNASGQLGDATALTKVNAVRVVTTEHFTAIAAGYAHNCALTADGRAFCWGDDHIGQLGNGAFGMSTTPVPVLAP